MGRNFIFYHMFCVNDAPYRFERTYKKIKNSGLLDFCDKIILVLVGKYNREYSRKVSELVKDKKIQYVFSSNDSSEVFTINLIFETATKLMYEGKDYNILYLHSKGVTRPHLTPQMIGWADYMEYYLIEEYERCFKVLENYSNCGVLYRGGVRIYGGNFWWAKCSHIRNLKPLSENSWRFDCEHWLLNNDIPEYSLSNKFDWAWGFYEKVCERKGYASLPEIVNNYSILPFIENSEINIDYARFGEIDCKEIIEKSTINNKIYLRADSSLINNLIVEESKRYLEIKINGKEMRINNEQFLMHGY